jgi:hypothetical protein
MEKLALQGLPASEMASCLENPDAIPIDDVALGKLAGLGMSLPCLSTVLLCFVLNSQAPWWNQTKGTGSEVPKRRRMSDK